MTRRDKREHWAEQAWMALFWCLICLISSVLFMGAMFLHPNRLLQGAMFCLTGCAVYWTGRFAYTSHKFLACRRKSDEREQAVPLEGGPRD